VKKRDQIELVWCINICKSKDSWLITDGDSNILRDIEWLQKHWSRPRSREMLYK